MGSSSQTTQQQSSSTPWAPQSAALQTAFTDANGALTQAQGATAPSNYVAQFTPDQLNVFKSMLGYGSSPNSGVDATSNAGASMSNAGANATAGALTGLSNYDPTKLNNTDAITAAAKQYADGQNIQAQTDAAMQQAKETARDVTLPQISQNAAINGNTNSSRTGIAEGLVDRSLAENAQNTYNSLYSNAYSNGLQLASGNANANNSNELGALTGAAGAGTNAVNSGTNATTSAINDQTGLYNLANTGATGEQQANQADLSNQLAKYQAQTQDPFAALQQYMGIVGSGNWGSNTTGQSTTTSDPSAFSTIAGLLGAGGSLAKGLGSMGVTGSGIMSGLGSMLPLLAL